MLKPSTSTSRRKSALVQLCRWPTEQSAAGAWRMQPCTARWCVRLCALLRQASARCETALAPINRQPVVVLHCTWTCTVITISRKRNKIQHVYHLNNTPLEAVTSAKYLGVTITSDLKWTQHINTVVNKANSTLAFLRRNLRIKSSDLKATAYKTLVRPIVEYASSVWDPATNNQILSFWNGLLDER